MIRSPLKAAHPGVLFLLLASPGLGAQQPRRIPPQVVQTLAQRQPVVTVDVKPLPATVNQPVDLRANVTPEVTGQLQYEFYIDGARVTECALDSPICQWTPGKPGPHVANAVVRRSRPGRGGRGVGELTLTGPRLSFDVQAEPVATPNPVPPTLDKPPTDKPPTDKPPTDKPPTDKPPTDKPPTDKPPTDKPPTDKPQTDQPAITRGAGIVLALRARPSRIDPGGRVTLEVSRRDGRPLTAYTLDRGDGSPPSTEGLGSLVISYARSGRYVVSVSPTAGVAGTPATQVIIVGRGLLPPWLYVVMAIGGVAIAVLIGAIAIRRTMRRRPHLPVAMFYPRRDVTPKFASSRTHGIALEIHYVPHLASVRYTPRVRIDQEK
jgi:hypothetical protein